MGDERNSCAFKHMMLNCEMGKLPLVQFVLRLHFILLRKFFMSYPLFHFCMSYFDFSILGNCIDVYRLSL